MSASVRILVVDNYDSFVYNLVQYLGELGAAVEVLRNDVATVGDVERFDGLLISPGPGHPRDAGNVESLIAYCAETARPLLGVCLGHQALGEVFGAQIINAPELLHGRSSVVTHDGLGLFAGVRSPLVVGRYHSLVVEESTLPDELVVTARSNGLVMGFRHATLPLVGVQFHPESVLTEDGYLVLANWLAVCGAGDLSGRARELSARADQIRASLPTTKVR
ncbi:MAG TPA: aminodeoxychorismate/anthranilate synthase component II [Acidimicrobiales bacterium]|nr:aminodeoxychorismate/anthranilate synthase component II [Acidimicrobiales bacterium]